MARKTTTVYVCDSCGAEVEKRRDLRKFAVEQYGPGFTMERATSTELCDECETKFLGAIVSFFDEERRETLAEMFREQKAA